MKRLVAPCRVVAIACVLTLGAQAFAFGEASPANLDGAGAAGTIGIPSALRAGVTGIDGRIEYDARAGSLIVRPVDGAAEATMSYFAYFAAPHDASRPIIFFYNGGPGVSAMWLHMGGFGPRRIALDAAQSNPSQPSYSLQENTYTLLDVADLVFVDAPGTGFGRLEGAGAKKAFLGIDADAKAFGTFIKQFVSAYGRNESPKLLFGESYGTMRTAVLAAQLERDGVRLSGVMMMSQVLDFRFTPFFSYANPGIEQAYALAIPSYAATAWFHNTLNPKPPGPLSAFLREVEQFADSDYQSALYAGSSLDPDRKRAVAEKLSSYVSIPAAQLLEADLRLTADEFRKRVLATQNQSVGLLDTRRTTSRAFGGLQGADFDPAMNAMEPAFVRLTGKYLETSFKVGKDVTYKGRVEVDADFDFTRPFGSSYWSPGGSSALPDLAEAMKTNPSLKVAVFSGYYDLSTPYHQTAFELAHLTIPAAQRANIEWHRYEGGHMLYADDAILVNLHEDISRFVKLATSQARGATE